MTLQLAPIPLNEDKSKAMYASDDCQMLLSMWEEFYRSIGFNLPWVGYVVKENETIIGSCAFTGAPKNNKVEVSYWTFKQYEGKGISSWSCSELIKLARAAKPDIIITAKTAPEHNASTKILQKNGFIFSGVVQDHEIGDAWGWVLK